MSMQNEVCEALDESLILGDALSPTHNEHVSSCTRCQGTTYMTNSIEARLKSVPASSAHKPLWIRELHARNMRVQKHKRWALGGTLVAAAAILLMLAVPRLSFRNLPEASQHATIERSADNNAQQDAPRAEQIGAARPSKERVRFILAVENSQGQAIAPMEAKRLLEWRLAKTFTEASVSVEGQQLWADIGSVADTPELVEQVSSLLDSPLGSLSFSVSRAGFMPSLCKYVLEDERAQASGIMTRTEQWSLDGDQRTFQECYLTTETADRSGHHSSGHHRLEAYLEGLERRFQVDAAHWIGYSSVEDATGTSRTRTHYLQAPTPGLDAMAIKNSSVYWNPDSQAPEVLIEFQEQAVPVFAQLTADNIGQRIALSLDDRVIFDATIAARVDGNSVSINVGSQAQDTQEATSELVNRVLTGPLTVRVVSSEQMAGGE